MFVIFDFMWLLEDYSYCKAGLAKGCNLAATESALVDMVTAGARSRSLLGLSLIQLSEPTRLRRISYAVFVLKQTIECLDVKSSLSN